MSLKSRYTVHLTHLRTVKELIPKKRGQPLLIGEELDEQVRDYIKELRREGEEKGKY